MYVYKFKGRLAPTRLLCLIWLRSTTAQTPEVAHSASHVPTQWTTNALDRVGPRLAAEDLGLTPGKAPSQRFERRFLKM